MANTSFWGNNLFLARQPERPGAEAPSAGLGEESIQWEPSKPCFAGKTRKSKGRGSSARQIAKNLAGLLVDKHIWECVLAGFLMNSLHACLLQFSELQKFIFSSILMFTYFGLCWVHLHWCTHRVSLVTESGVYCLVPARGLLIAVASLAAELRLLGMGTSVVATSGLSSCHAQVSLPYGMWDLPGAGIKPMSLAFAGGFSSIGPPGEPFFSSFREWRP